MNTKGLQFVTKPIQVEAMQLVQANIPTEILDFINTCPAQIDHDDGKATLTLFTPEGERKAF